MTRYEACLAHTLREESGIVQAPGQPFRRGAYSFMDHPSDRQGATMMGVTHREYYAYRTAHGLEPRDVREVEDDEIWNIFRDGYWLLVRADDLPAGLDLAVFDYAVNSGPFRAIQKLQSVLGIHIDGHLGAVTLAAARNCDVLDVLPRYMAARRDHCRGLGNYGAFKVGWEKRWSRIEAASLAMAAHVEHATAPATDQDHAPAPKAVSTAPASMASSDTGNAAANAAGGGITTAGIGVAQAIKEVSVDRVPSTLDVLLALATQPVFWLGVSIVFSAVYIWFERRSKLIREHV